MSKAADEIGRLFGEGTVAGLSDGQLLDRFASRGDGEAFAAIVARHGDLVLAACRSSLGPRAEADPDDAFQATFIILARRAGSFPLTGSLAAWLCRVARRVSRQARIEAARRRGRERVVANRGEARAPVDPDRDEVRDLIHQELARLPDRYRLPLLLCDLHGLTRDEAAASIGCPPGTVAGRLARAREKLRGRLERRGITSPSAWLAAAGLSIEARSGLFQAAARSAVAAARGEAVATATAAARLATGASRGLFAARASAILALSTTLTASGTLMAFLALRAGGGPASNPAGPASIPQAPQVEAKPIDPEDPALADVFCGKVVDAAGQPLAGARLSIVPTSRDLSKPGDVRAATDADGRFRFSAKDLTFRSLDGLPRRRPGLLIATLEGYGPDWVSTWGETGSSFVSHSDPEKTAEWILTLVKDDVPIRGRLLGPDGRPIAGAGVRLSGLLVPRDRNLDAHLERMKRPLGLFAEVDYERSLYSPWLLPASTTKAVTDADGRFQFDGLGRDRLASLEIKASGFVASKIEVMTRDSPDLQNRPGVDPAEGATFGASFTIKLEPGGTLTGLVRDKATGRPLADVWVGPGVAAIAGLGNGGRYPHATDAQGRFSIGGLSPDFKGQDVLAVPKPGLPYFLAKATANDAGEAVVDCPGGIPFRLTLRDQSGQLVEADVSYSAIQQNENFYKRFSGVGVQAGTPISRAARQADGSYLGVALPGPGVVTAETPRAAGYRPAHVDPKAFFAPGKVDWSSQEMITTYGTHDTVMVATFYGGAWLDQHDYAAIVLINPPEGSKTLELAATVEADRPRPLMIVDPEGRPVVGVTTSGMTYHPWDSEPTLRASTFPLKGLRPDRGRRITFYKEDRKLIGFLMARGDGDSPYTVRMQPWATLTGRIVDEKGQPLGVDGGMVPGRNQSRASLYGDTKDEFAALDDPGLGIFPIAEADGQGRFRVEKLVPGLAYTAHLSLGIGQPRGTIFRGLKLESGEVRDLGDILARPTVVNKP